MCVCACNTKYFTRVAIRMSGCCFYFNTAHSCSHRIWCNCTKFCFVTKIKPFFLKYFGINFKLLFNFKNCEATDSPIPQFYHCLCRENNFKDILFGLCVYLGYVLVCVRENPQKPSVIDYKVFASHLAWALGTKLSYLKSSLKKIEWNILPAFLQ